MVNWKVNDATDRLFGALIAAHPELRLDYNAMAAMYGRGATYDAIEGRFRKFRKVADELRSEATANGVTVVPRGGRVSVGTPRTPRTPRGPRNTGINKSGGSSKIGSSSKLDSKILSTPTKKNGNVSVGQSMLEAITLDTDDDSKSNSTLNGTGASASSSFGHLGAINIKDEDDGVADKHDDLNEVCHILRSIENFKEEQVDGTNDQNQQGKAKTGNNSVVTFLASKPRTYVNSQTNGYLHDAAASVHDINDMMVGAVAGPVTNTFDLHLNGIGGLYFGANGHHTDHQYHDDVDLYADTA